MAPHSALNTLSLSLLEFTTRVSTRHLPKSRLTLHSSAKEKGLPSFPSKLLHLKGIS